MMIYDSPPFQEGAIGLCLPASDKLPGYVVIAEQISKSTSDRVKVQNSVK